MKEKTNKKDEGQYKLEFIVHQNGMCAVSVHSKPQTFGPVYAQDVTRNTSYKD